MDIFNIAGRLAGAAAHDFNNILTGVLGNLELMQRRADRLGTADFNDYLTGARSAAARGVEFAQSLLAVAGHQLLETSEIPAAAFLQTAAANLGASLAGRATLNLEIATGAPPIFCDEAKLQEALQELAGNAVQAGADHLALSAQILRLNDPQAGRLGLPPGHYTAISMQDNGAGMSAEIAAHAFEPFFTSRGANGLGLSKILGFTRQSGGHALIAAHQPGRTIITLLLPATQPDD